MTDSTAARVLAWLYVAALFVTWLLAANDWIQS